MALIINDNVLNTLINKNLNSMKPNEAQNTIEQLGTLAPWCLKKEVYDKADISWEQPKLLSEIGAVWVLLALKTNIKSSVFRPAFIVPLRWVNHLTNHDHRLPSSLTDLADKITEQLKAENWKLQLCIDVNLSFISGEKLSWDSAWASLYTGLNLAMHNTLPDPKVLSSGAWDFQEKCLISVKSIDLKSQAAQEFGAEHFFIPEFPSGVPKILNLEFHTLQKGKNNPNLVIQELRSMLMQEPVSNDKKDLEFYYLNMRRDDKQKKFYLERIKPILVKQMKSQEIQGEKSLPENATLISWVSHGSELIDIGIQLFQPKRVVLLYTEDSSFEKDANSIMERYHEIGISEIVLKKYGNNLELNELRKKMKKLFLETEIDHPSKFLVDTTLGTVSMSIALYDAAPEDAVFLYWNKQTNEYNIPRPFSTRPELWKREYLLQHPRGLTKTRKVD